MPRAISRGVPKSATTSDRSNIFGGTGGLTKGLEVKRFEDMLCLIVVLVEL